MGSGASVVPIIEVLYMRVLPLSSRVSLVVLFCSGIILELD